MKKARKKKAFDPQTFLALAGAGKTILNFTKGRIIFTQGDAANNVFYIQSGKVKMTVVSERGKEAIVGILEAGQFFGEGCLDGHSVRIATAKALEPSVITSIAKKAILLQWHLRNHAQRVLRARAKALPVIERQRALRKACYAFRMSR
jgi:CRP-like cAMP-binding protein